MSDEFSARLNDLVQDLAPQLAGGFEEIYVDYSREKGELSVSVVDLEGREAELKPTDGMEAALRALLAVQFPHNHGPVECCTVEIENGGDVQIDAKFVEDAPAR